MKESYVSTFHHPMMGISTKIFTNPSSNEIQALWNQSQQNKQGRDDFDLLKFGVDGNGKIDVWSATSGINHEDIFDHLHKKYVLKGMFLKESNTIFIREADDDLKLNKDVFYKVLMEICNIFKSYRLRYEGNVIDIRKIDRDSDMIDFSSFLNLNNSLH
jgi:hypothetical protein